MPNNTKNSFILYSEYNELISELSNEEAGKLIKAVFDYAETGKIRNLNGAAKMVFITMRQSMDRNSEKYEKIVEKRKIAGSLGGKKRAENLNSNNNIEANAAFAKKNLANQADNDNDNVSVSVSVSDNVSDNVLSISPVENGVNTESVNTEVLQEPASPDRGWTGGRTGINLNCSGIKNLPPTTGGVKYKDVTEADKLLIERYVKKNKLATKNVRAYVNKIIANGDHIRILEEERKREKKKKVSEISPDERIKAEIASIHDKKSALKVLARYHNALEDFPPPLEKIAKQYNLDTGYKLEKYYYELYYQKQHSPPDTG